MKTYKLSSIKDKRILGRNVKNAAENDLLALFWGGSALEVNIKAKEIWIEVSSEYDTFEAWISVWVNNSQISRFMAPKEKQWICVARNMNPDKENLITIMKDTQPMSGEAKHSLFLSGIGLDEEGKFLPLKDRKLNIEFVGDSITTGEGLAGAVDEWEWITQWFSTSKTYELQAAKALDANWSVFSQGGWGICWGWDGNRHTNMPAHYEKVCSVMWGPYQEGLGVKQDYDFGKGSDYVFVNLGTNDNGAFFQPPWKDENGKEYKLSVDKIQRACEKDGLVITAGVKNFLKVIRKHNPSAKIVWLWGMIKLVAVPDFIKLGIAEYKEEADDDAVYTLELDDMSALEHTAFDKGSRGHPGPATHRAAAEKIISFIRSLEA